MPDVFLGTSHTGRWATDGQRPKNWRKKVYELEPNGDVALAGILSMLPSDPVDDPEYYWWIKRPRAFGGTVAGVYKNPQLTTAYGAATYSKGQEVHLKVAESVASLFRPQMEVLMHDADDFTKDIVGKVIEVAKNGDSSRVSVRLLEADGSNYLGSCDTVTIVGDMHPENSEAPQALSHDPVKYYNYTQILREPVRISRTASGAKYRTGNKKAQLKRDAADQWMRQLERAVIWGVKHEGTGDNGMRESSFQGIVRFIKQYAAANIQDYRTITGSEYEGKTWLQAGETWLENLFSTVFKYGSSERLFLMSNAGITAIQRVIKEATTYQITGDEKYYGLNVRNLRTPFGEVKLKAHKMWNQSSAGFLQYKGLIVDPANTMRLRPYVEGGEMHYIKARNDSTLLDGTIGDWIGELGFEFWAPETAAYVDGIGQDNTVGL